MYFDYSATTPICKKSLDAYVDISSKLVGNHQSKHDLGLNIQAQINKDSKQFKTLLNLPSHFLTFTQNATMANKIILEHILHDPLNMHVLCGPFEHSSIVRVLGPLQRKGLKVEVLKTDKQGNILIDTIRTQIQDKTKLVIVSAVDSELGIIQDVNAIKNMIGDIPMLVDATQSITKVDIDFKKIDYITFSAHKFYGPKGIGGFFSLKELTPHLGTQSYELIHSACVALEDTLNQDESNVIMFKDLILKSLQKEKQISINNPHNSIPHIINMSLNTKDSVDLVTHFSKQGIYVSKGSACTKENYSPNVYRLTQDLDRATSSIRISLSHLTTKKEVEALIKTIKEVDHL